MGLAATTWVPMGARVPVLSPNDHPNPSDGQQKDFRKNQILENCQVPLKSLKNSNFGAFVGHSSGYMGLAATMWVPMGAIVPVLSPNDQRRQKAFAKIEIFSQPMPPKTAKSSLVGPKRGADLGKAEMAPGTSIID